MSAQTAWQLSASWQDAFYGMGVHQSVLRLDASLTHQLDAGTRAFEDLDYILISRLCDCIDLSLKYRQVRREIWFEIGLAAFPQSRLQLQIPRR